MQTGSREIAEMMKCCWRNKVPHRGTVISDRPINAKCAASHPSFCSLHLKPKVWLDWKLSWGGSGLGSKWPCAPFPSKKSSASVLSKLSH